MSFAFRRNTIVCSLEHRLRNRRVCCRAFFSTLVSASFCIKSIFLRISLFPLLPLLLFIDFTLSSTFIQFTISCFVSRSKPVFFIPYVRASLNLYFFSFLCFSTVLLPFFFSITFTFLRVSDYSHFPFIYHLEILFALLFPALLLFSKVIFISFSHLLSIAFIFFFF